jgi:hypothetical protein
MARISHPDGDFDLQGFLGMASITPIIYTISESYISSEKRILIWCFNEALPE